jgi:hypothetical protein
MGPHITAITEDGNYPINPLLPNQPNPYSLLTVQDKGSMDRILGNINISTEPIKGLILKLNVGTDIAYQGRRTYMPKSTLHGALSGGIATINQSLNEQYLRSHCKLFHEFNEIHHRGISRCIKENSRRTEILTATIIFTDGFGWNNLNAGSVQNSRLVGGK